ncbi:MAG: spore germination protein [Limnochordia bacterium]
MAIILKRIKELLSPKKTKSEAKTRLTKDLKTNRAWLEEIFGQSSDVIIREYGIGYQNRIKVMTIYIEGLVDTDLLVTTLLKPMTSFRRPWPTGQEAYQDLKGRYAMNNVTETPYLEDFVAKIMVGHCGLLIDGVDRGCLGGVQKAEYRGINEPDTEPNIRGPKEGFTEILRINTSILRRRIRHPRLRIYQRQLGRLSNTPIAIAYIDGLAQDEVLRELKQRLDNIDIDAIHESGVIEELIEDEPFSPFPTILRTERPDRVTGALLEGRVAILTDGTPFALILPATFTMFITTSEDYYERFIIAGALRLIRIAAFFISLLLPSLYVAIVTFHQEMLPTPLILSIAAQREGVPFPAIVEALLMELTFEVLREAGVRLPQIIGAAISIIGALVLGDAAIRAGLVSPAMVVVVAATGVASFATPAFSLAIATRLLRFPMILLAASLGLFGVVAGLFALLIHLTTLRSFGQPYLEPLAPIVMTDMKDTILRLPWWALDTRPKLVGGQDPVRQGPDQKPTKPDD